MLKKVLIIITVLAVAFIAVVLWPQKPIAPRNPDLLLARSQIASNENAFYLISDPNRFHTLSDAQKAEISATLETTNSAQIHSTLDKYNQQLKQFDDVLALSQFEITEPELFTQEFPYLTTWRSMGHLNLIRAHKLFLEGKTGDAFKTARRGTDFGARIKSGNGQMLHYLIGAAIKSQSEESIRKMALRSTNVAVLRKELALLKASNPDLQALTNVFKVEYETLVRSINKLADGEFPGTLTTEAARWGWKIGGRFLLSKEKTEALAAEITRKNLSNISKVWAQMDTNLPPSPATNMARTIIEGNSVGSILLQIYYPAINKILSRKCHQTVGERATLLTLAIRLYELANGTLPDTLSDLVPKYIDAVPMDDFDGKPIRYSKTKKIIYSVGEDLVDSDGQEKDTQKKRLDIVYPLEYKEPKQTDFADPEPE